MSELPKIIDNERRKLLEVIGEISSEFEELSIATGYWDLPGTELILDKIAKYKKIRLLIGREPLIPRHKQSDPEVDYPDKDMFEDLQLLQPTESLKNTVIKLKELIDSGVLEVRVYKKTFFHSKCYIFGGYESERGVGIIGSANFTKNGLTKNAELNALESDHRIVFYKPQTEEQEFGHLSWFDHFWNDDSTEEWNGAFTELLSESTVGDELFSPYQTYIKTLYELYKDELEDIELSEGDDAEFDLFAFQMKNVQALLRRLKKYGVAMLADSVGLGKTFTAIEVIKQYQNSESGRQRVEVICPKSLVEQWKQEAMTQGIELHPITLQNKEQIKKQKKLDDIANVTLFVIDESHNLKNRASKRFDQIVQWIKNNPKSRVLLLTATPINNQLTDITNQILLGAKGRADIFTITTTKNNQVETIDFNQAIENLKKKIGQDIKKDGTIDYEYIRQVMSPILRAFVVRQTRQGIQREYGGLMMGDERKEFPDVIPEVKKYSFTQEMSQQIQDLTSDTLDLHKIYSLKPQVIVENTKNLLHPIDQIEKLELGEPFDSKNSPVFFVYQIILLLGFLPYRWRLYQTKFYGKTRKQIKDLNLTESAKESKSLFLQLSIYGILRTMFLKRMESSVNALKKSLETYKRKLDVFERGIEVGNIVSVKDLQKIEEQLEMQSEEYDIDEVDIDEESVVDTIEENKYNVEALKKDIAIEKELISILEKQMSILEKDDIKLKSFAKLLDKIVENDINKGKVLVFSFYADTVKYLEENLLKYTDKFNKDNVAFLTSKNKKDVEEIVGKFAPKAKNYKLASDEEELSCLISTDVLSEGQNLQDCGVLVNYDLHWNPVRMIQRNGRVNRLGTEYDSVYIYNLSPEKNIEEHLKLIESLEKKINLIKNTIGTDTPVLDEEENPIEFNDSWKDIYSEDMQARKRAMEEAERESDLLLAEDIYISDLKKFDDEQEEKMKHKVYNIPLGKWALMPNNNHKNNNERPGVLAMNTLRFADEEGNIKDVGHTFLAMSRDTSVPVRYISTLEALEWLKTEQNFSKISDKISCDKSLIAKNANEKAETSEVVTGSLIGQENDLIDILWDNHLPEEDINAVEDAFHTQDVLAREKIKQLKCGIIKNNKENTVNLELFNKLVNIAKEANEADFVEQSDVDHNVQQLIYVRENN